jgi:prophage maintenance system killer protein
LSGPVHDLDFDTLVFINKQVVSITGDRHGYAEEDAARMKALLKDVEDTAGAGDASGDVLEKASLLMFRIASGQNFHEGNKRTALVAGAAFLRLNGYTLEVKDPDLVSVVDRAGMSTAGLDDVRTVLRDRVKRGKRRTQVARRTVEEIVKRNREFLSYIGSENRGDQEG